MKITTSLETRFVRIFNTNMRCSFRWFPMKMRMSLSIVALSKSTAAVKQLQGTFADA
ncbi:Uncharacterized protein APZ42_020945 [Daphnia magna]|uniref:Uncharacterized protein n=1 Tax=Daphnia magna TaxID=35525 RepID=A0A164X3N2_9CRUS|nr:Uncharacterized protein APZ42_020945 [Daphnia magna]